MKKYTFEIEAVNIKKHAHFKERFESGYVYLVKGDFELGKTTILQLISMMFRVDNPNPNIISFGAHKASAQIDITKQNEVVLGDGEKWILKMDKTEGKSEKFSLIMPDAGTKKTKEEIRNILRYNSFTTEFFLARGLTAEGRRWQGEVVSQFFPKDIKARLKAIDDLINTKSGTLYVTRSGKNETYTKAKNAYDLTPTLTIEDKNLISNEAKTVEAIDTIKTELDALQGMLRGNNENLTKRESLVANLKSYKDEKSRIEQRLAELNKSISLCENELAVIPDTNFDEEKYNSLKTRYEKGTAYIQTINEAKKKKENLDIAALRMNDAKTEWEAYDKKIEELREEKQELFNNAKLPMDNIVIDDGELFMIDDDGNKLNFVEEQISYSNAGIKIARLLLELNKNIPFICLGKGESYGGRMEELDKLAKEYNAVILCDKVVEGQEELSIEIYEPHND